jgi:hypothetical protein
MAERKLTRTLFQFASCLAVLAVSSLSYAGNEGPVGSPLPPSVGCGTQTPLPGCALPPTGRVLAEYRTYGGYVPHPEVVRGFRVYASGAVLSFVDGQELYASQLSLQNTELLESVSSVAEGSDLVDGDPAAPECADAPIQSYVLVRPDGEKVEIVHALSNCHRLFPVNGRNLEVERILFTLHDQIGIKNY